MRWKPSPPATIARRVPDSATDEAELTDSFHATLPDRRYLWGGGKASIPVPLAEQSAALPAFRS